MLSYCNGTDKNVQFFVKNAEFSPIQKMAFNMSDILFQEVCPHAVWDISAALKSNFGWTSFLP